MTAVSGQDASPCPPPHTTIRLRAPRLVLCAANRQPLSLMKRAGFLEELGDGNLFDSLDEAYAALRGASRSA